MENIGLVMLAMVVMFVVLDSWRRTSAERIMRPMKAACSSGRLVIDFTKRDL